MQPIRVAGWWRAHHTVPELAQVMEMDNETIIMAGFPGPGILRCEVEKIAAGQTRRG